MRPQDKDTICASITAPGEAGVSVLRVSGDKTVAIVRQLCPFLPDQLESHRIYYGFAKDSKNLNLDEVLVSYFRAGRSFTGEETFEISCHGSQVIVAELLDRLCCLGARLATRGEFSYRAFMNGRLDLVQAESILDVIQSRSSRGAAVALRQLQGGLSDKLRDLLKRLTWVLANLEANIDFSSEDIEVASHKQLARVMRELRIDVETLLSSQIKSRILKSGFQVLLVGRPNVGKSSLLNALVNDERAIVTEIAGTTRDLLEAELSVNGFRMSLFDSAGIRETSDVVERIGVDKMLAKSREVDLILYVVDGGVGWTPEDHNYLRQQLRPALVVWNKCDLSSNSNVPDSFRTVQVSAKSRIGLPDLITELADLVGKDFIEDAPALVNARHAEGLRKLEGALAVAADLMDADESPDLIALELQEGLQVLHELLGIVFDDQVMDRVFQEFCIGK